MKKIILLFSLLNVLAVAGVGLQTGKSGILAIDTLKTHEWDVSTDNEDFWLGMGFGLVFPGGTHYYTGHYVRASFLTGIEGYLLSEIFYNYDIRVDKRKENAKQYLLNSNDILKEMAQDPLSTDFSTLQADFRIEVSKARKENDVIEENAGLLTSQMAWLGGLHLYSIMDGYGVLQNNNGRTTTKRDVGSVVWRAVLLPGWGQIYNREWGKAGLLYMSFIGSYYSYFARQHTVEYYLNRLRVARVENVFGEVEYLNDKLLFFRKKRNQYIWGGILFYLYSVADAAVDAMLSDFDSPVHLSLELPKSQLPGIVLSFKF